MKILGYSLLIAGFLGGALLSVLDVEAVQWTLFALAVAVGAAGVALIRLSAHQQVRSVDKVAANLTALGDSLENVVRHIDKLNQEFESIHPCDVHHHIDELFTDDLLRFSEFRHALSVRYGLTAYSEIMSPFAAGERLLNRAWSASADGYVDEVRTSLKKSQVLFLQAREKLSSFQAPTVREGTGDERNRSISPY
jgi:hypothetical protein